MQVQAAAAPIFVKTKGCDECKTYINANYITEISNSEYSDDTVQIVYRGTNNKETVYSADNNEVKDKLGIDILA